MNDENTERAEELSADAVVGVVAKEIEHRYQGVTRLEVSRLCSRLPVQRRRVQALLSRPRRLEELARLLKVTRVTYAPQEYVASGRGDFGRDKGGRAGYTRPATLLITR